MRIITGKYGRRRFQVPTTFNARPTTDFAKENLFNVLDNLIDWEDVDALDLFAGTGSISFEMLSRGCRSVTAIELNFKHATFIQKVANELKISELKLMRGDVMHFLTSAVKPSFDLIFADPPYNLSNLPDLPNLVLNNNLLRKGGMFVLEHSNHNNFSALPFFTQQRVYGSVNFSFFVKK
ncbi:MAG: 16S rRNA (guanine(966)-N(2))-methyltransferase RsmD [Tannerella sp.]|jgi:16S rRNA (guanine(966)-N(2))-methyltransferase RsmD|nr:16S rRNA (guanine(966)-N(2))-methyltransferase RsmD [Tannerella sp.]